MDNFKWLGQSLYYSRELIKYAIFPFQVVGWIADKIVSLVFVGMLAIGALWYFHYIPETQIDDFMNNIGSRIISHIGALNGHSGEAHHHSINIPKPAEGQ